MCPLSYELLLIVEVENICNMVTENAEIMRPTIKLHVNFSLCKFARFPLMTADHQVSALVWYWLASTGIFIINGCWLGKGCEGRMKKGEIHCRKTFGLNKTLTCLVFTNTFILNTDVNFSPFLRPHHCLFSRKKRKRALPM